MTRSLIAASFALIAFNLPALGDDSASAAAQADWDRHCRRCHAADGSASTPLGKRLKIRDYTKAESLAELTDQQLFDMTKHGVEGTQMPGYADKLSDDEIHALVALMRAMVK